MRKAWIVIAVLFVCCHLSMSAQTNAANLPYKKVFYGGNVGFNIASDFWLINVSPLVGYNFTRPLAGGVGLIYQYESNSRPVSYDIHSYGGTVFLRYDLSANLMKDLPFGILFQTDYEGTQNKIRFKDHSVPNETVYIDRLFLGAGYIQPISNRSRVFLLISFDMLDLNNGRGIQPLIRGGIMF